MNTSRPSVCRWTLMLSVVLTLFTLGVSAAPELRVFTAGSFAAIRAATEGRPMVVAFWSTTCAPCAEELGLLARLHREFPRVKVVLVAADAPELRPQVERFLSRYAIGSVELWQFGAEAEDRLRYSVDRAWRGELPRAYFIGVDGQPLTRSGVPDETWAGEWFQRENAAATVPAS